VIVPTYQYACTECGHAFEQFQSFSEDALSVCPSCNGKLRKLFNAVGVVFKGSGFYRNDSRGSSTSAATATAGTSAASSSSDSSSSTGGSTTATAAAASVD
jgi:putative FmdB family regulatory protein